MAQSNQGWAVTGCTHSLLPAKQPNHTHSYTHTRMHLHRHMNERVYMHAPMLLYVQTQPPVKFLNYVIKLSSSSPPLTSLPHLLKSFYTRLSHHRLLCHGTVIFITFNDIKMMEHIFPKMNEKDKLGRDGLKRQRDGEIWGENVQSFFFF